MDLITLDFSTLNPEKKHAYLLLTEPRFRSCFSGKDPFDISFGTVFGLGIEEKGIPVGLCLGAAYPDLYFGEIFTLFIIPPYRKRGFGTSLFKEMEKTLSQQKCNLLVFKYRKEESTTPYLEKIFEKTEWNPPHPFIQRYFFEAWSFNPPWFNHPPPLPKGYREFKWSNLKPKEADALKHGFEQGRYPSELSPFKDEKNITPVNSLGIREGNRVVAWAVCHKISPDTIRYTTLYAEPELQKKGLPIRLLVDSMDLHRKSPIRWALFETNLRNGDKSWQRFVDKRLAPYAIDYSTIYRSWKEIA